MKRKFNLVEKLPKNAKQIPDYPRYYATPEGDIYSLYRGNIHKMQFSLSAGYYKSIFTHISGERKFKRVHILIGLTFIPNPNNLPCLNHIDMNILNNHVSNLEWVTQRENHCHYVIRKYGKVGYHWNKNENHYISLIRINGKSTRIGSYKTAIEAQQAYYNKCKELGINNKYSTPCN